MATTEAASATATEAATTAAATTAATTTAAATTAAAAAAATSETDTHGLGVQDEEQTTGSNPGGSVFEDYDCMLNQTNISKNNNKYYRIRLIESGNQYRVWTTRGRVGDPETTAVTSEEFTDVKKAIRVFEKKFRDKTKTKWADRANFKAEPGKYTLIEVEPQSGDVEENLKKRDIMPLGKLSKAQVAKGFEALEEIEAVINDEKTTSEKTLKELSSKFYTLIPHSFGRRLPPTISQPEIIQSKKDMLRNLNEIATT